MKQAFLPFIFGFRANKGRAGGLVVSCLRLTLFSFDLCLSGTGKIKDAISRFLFASVIVATLSASVTSACPLVDGFVDYNCDGKIRIAFAGDSIVWGVGDNLAPEYGYVGRIQARFPKIQVENLGIPGISSDRLLRVFKKHFRALIPGETSIKTTDLDALIVAVGVNDYWRKRPAADSALNISRIVRFLRAELGKNGKVAPLIAVSEVLPTNRTFQGPFIVAVNLEIRHLFPKVIPYLITHPKFPKRLLTPDGLHPSSEGYSYLAREFMRNLRGSMAKFALSHRLDLDSDGIFDLFEVPKFGIDPKSADTDGGGVNDGEEVFVNFTDPLNAEDDFSTPTPTPTPTPTATITPDITPTLTATSTPSITTTPIFTATHTATPATTESSLLTESQQAPLRHSPTQ